jgi:hypothetical protein
MIMKSTKIAVILKEEKEEGRGRKKREEALLPLGAFIYLVFEHS